MEEPLIIGERVTLRPLRPSDAESIYENVRDKEIARWTAHVPHPYPRDGALKFIKGARKKWREGTGHTFGILVPGARAPVGVVSLMGVDKAQRSCELGYWLGKRHWGHGYMTEAVELALSYAFGGLGMRRINVKALAANVASNRVIEKSGFKFEGIERESRKAGGTWCDLKRYGLLAREFRR